MYFEPLSVHSKILWSVYIGLDVSRLRLCIGLRVSSFTLRMPEVLNSALPAWVQLNVRRQWLTSPLLGKRGHSPGGGGRPLAGHKAHLQGHLRIGLWFSGRSPYPPLGGIEFLWPPHSRKRLKVIVDPLASTVRFLLFPWKV